MTTQRWVPLLALSSRGDDAHGSDDGPFRLGVVNATWGQTGYPFQPAYVDVLGADPLPRSRARSQSVGDFSARPVRDEPVFLA